MFFGLLTHNQRTEVRQSTWGLGLFLREDAEKADLITGTRSPLFQHPIIDHAHMQSIPENSSSTEQLTVESASILFIHITHALDYRSSLISSHRGRVYLFELNPTLSIDSSKLGNESRFINHDPSKANAEAGST
jgi:hypothetical protein